MKYTDIFIRRPVLATVVSLMILVLGLRAVFSLPVLQYPRTENSVITVTTVYYGADADVVAGFITTPLENAIAQANGIDYMTSNSRDSVSTITATLRLNQDSNKALTEITTKINSVLNQLPPEAQNPVISMEVGETIAAMYIGFSSEVLPQNGITDYITRVVQPQLQSVEGVQTAEIFGGQNFALRAWLDPEKLAAYSLTAADISAALARNNYISGLGKTKGQMVQVSLTASTGLTSLDEFRRLAIREKDGAIVRLEDVANVTLGADDYESSVAFDGKKAVYVAIKIAPTANLLEVIDSIRKIFPQIQENLPQGLDGQIVYDSTKFVKSSIYEVIRTLIEALFIVTVVIFAFLGSPRSVIIPSLAIPLSLVGTFSIMMAFGFSINLLTLLALVLAIGLVVDDAIVVVENVNRHMDEGQTPYNAAIMAARELANPIIAMTIVLIAVYVPVGFQGGLTGALFTEFAITLAGSVTISAVIALTLSPMMCAKLLKPHPENPDDLSPWQEYLLSKIDEWHDFIFGRRVFYIYLASLVAFGALLALYCWLAGDWAAMKIVAYPLFVLPVFPIVKGLYLLRRERYERMLRASFEYLPVTMVFSAIVIGSIFYLYGSSKQELAPQEDQGILISFSSSAPNATLQQRKLYSAQVYDIFHKYEETDHVFQMDIPGMSISGMVLDPWDMRERTSNVLQPLVQEDLNKIAGAKIAAFQPPPLPGSRGMPVQFVINTTKSFEELHDIAVNFAKEAQKSGMFIFIDSDLKIDQPQSIVEIDRDKTAQMGLTMSDVGNALSSMLGGGYVNYFSLDGRSYKVIPQVQQRFRLNPEQLENYYVKSGSGAAIPLSTIADIRTKTIPQTLNRFQQMNAATISGVMYPGISQGEALEYLEDLAKRALPEGYATDFAGQSRQFYQETSGFALTFAFALLIIFLALAAQFESFRDPITILISVPMAVSGALIFISMGINGASVNIYTQVGLVTLMGLISKHGILIAEFANNLMAQGMSKKEAIITASGTRLRPILMTTASTVVGVMPLIFASGAGAASRFNMGLVITAGLIIGTMFTLFVHPAVVLLIASEHKNHEH